MNKGEIVEQLRGPLIVKETRVRRLYKGGALLDKFRGKKNLRDGFCPEDWIGSTTQAINRDLIIGEGISKVILKNTKFDSTVEISLQEILNIPEYAYALFGEGVKEGKTPGILVKLLDSLTRLPLQTHPDKKFVEKYFNDAHGKCESWIILGGRKIKGEDPHVYFGFTENVTKEQFYKGYYNQDSKLMLSLLNKIYVRPGDVFYIEPNIIHAIGPGVFLLEIQEPSDYVFQFERKGECWELNDYEVHMGLGEKIMLNSINFNLKGNSLLCKNFFHRDIYYNLEDIMPLFSQEQGEYFGCELISSSKIIQRKHESIHIGIVIKGNLTLILNDHPIYLRKGDTYILPAPSYNRCFSSICEYKNESKNGEGEFFVVLEAFPV